MNKNRTSPAVPAATPRPPAAVSGADIRTAAGLPVFRVRVRSLFGDAVLTVPASNAADARQRVIDGFAAGVNVEG